MTYNRRPLGSRPRLRAVFTDSDLGGVYDPEVVRLTIEPPSGADPIDYVYGTDAEIIKESTGTYVAYVDADAAGFWRYRWWATGDGQAAARHFFEVTT